MKISTKKWLLITFLCFLIAREFAPFYLSYYKSNWNSNITSQSNCTKTKSSDRRIYLNTVDFDEVSEVGIIYNGLEEVTTNSSDVNIIVNIHAPTIFSWKSYIPFYKNINLDYTFTYRFITRIKLNQETTSISCSGKISISGSYRIIGICSGKEAQKIIRDKIRVSVKSAITEKVQEQIDDIR